MTPEFSRTVRVDTLGPEPKGLVVEADAQERSALAARFDLAGIDSLSAELRLTRNGEGVIASGRLRSDVIQHCVATGEPVPARVEEPFTIVFRPHPQANEDDEIEISEGELDVVFFDGALLDVGEAVAETLSLSLDPYPRSAEAETALREVGVLSEDDAKPAGALAGLRDLLTGKKP